MSKPSKHIAKLRTALFPPLKKHGLYILGLLVFPLILFFSYLFTNSTILSAEGLDIAQHFYYAQSFIADEVAQGNIPLWDPYTYGGHSFIGQFQSALFYPSTWLLLFLPVVTAINWSIAIHVFLLGLFVYVWACRRDLSSPAAFMGAIAAMLGGSFFLHIYAGHLSNLWTMAWAPLVFVGIDGWLRHRNARWIFLAAAAAAMQIFAGHPQYVYYTAIVAGLYSLALLLRPEVPKKGRAAIGLLLIYPLAAVLSAAQLLPGVLSTTEVVRSTPLLEFSSMFSLPPENLLTFFSPWFLGDMKDVPYWGRCFLWEMQLFFGIGMLMLAAFGFGRISRSQRWSFVALIAAVLLLALGARTPLYSLLYKYLPLYSSFRGTSKFIFFIGLFLSLFVAYGADRLWKEKPSMRFVGIWTGLGLLLLITGIGIYSGILQGIWEMLYASLSTSDERMYLSYAPEMLPAFQSATGLSLIGAGVTLIIFSLLLFGSMKNRYAIILFLCLSVLELFIFAKQSTVGFPIERLPDNMLTQVLGKGPGNYRSLNLISPDVNLKLRSPGLWGTDPSVSKRYAEFMFFSQGENPDQATQNLVFRNLPPIFSMLRSKFAIIPEETNARVLELSNPLPRYLMSPNYIVLKNRDDIFNLLASPNFNPTQLVILEQEPNPLPEKADIQFRIQQTEESTDHILFEIECSHAGIMLMTDVYSKDWKITAMPHSDQSNYEILPANYILRAIPLSAGKHSFRMEYKPSGIKTGIILSISAILLVLLCLALPSWRKQLDFN